MKVRSIWLRRIHKWVGVLVGLQFLLWALSGTAMALLDMDEVAGGASAERRPPAMPSTAAAWPAIQQSMGDLNVSAVRLRPLLDRTLIEVQAPNGPILFDPSSGQRVIVGAPVAAAVAAAAHPDGLSPIQVRALDKLELAVREHELPIWRADFNDSRRSSYYVSAATGELLERRNESWRWWDFFWMLHNMDYAQRVSFNHPLIIAAGIAMVWLAATGFWLLFRTMWRHDFSWLKRSTH